MKEKLTQFEFTTFVAISVVIVVVAVAFVVVIIICNIIFSHILPKICPVSMLLLFSLPLVFVVAFDVDDLRTGPICCGGHSWQHFVVVMAVTLISAAAAAASSSTSSLCNI